MLRITDEQWELIRKHFPEEHYSRRSSWPQAHSCSQSARGGAVDSQHRSPMAHASAVLPELQDGTLPLSAVVRERSDPCRAHGLANMLREQGEIDESECYIDATFASAKGGGEQIAPTERGKGVKIMAIVDRHGAARGHHPRRESPRSHARAIDLRLLHDRSQARESDRRQSLRQRSTGCSSCATRASR